MYANFYNLKKEPFHITPDPEFLFLSSSHKQALGSIIYGVEKGKGFIVITGEIGVGKTTILRSYLESINKDQLRIIYIFNANISFHGLLKKIYQELELPDETDNVSEMVNRLHEAMINEYKQGRTVVLIIDEAQNMPVETLENLRMLSNLETSTDKLIQIVLVGQPEFARILNLDLLRQLNQRIAIRCTIIPFTKEESLAYIQHRLSRVVIDDRPVFTKGALKKIVKRAKGIPRTLNILCDNALITGFGYKKKPVNVSIVKEVMADFEGRAKPSPLRWAGASAASILLIAGLFLIYSYRDSIISGIEQLISSSKGPLPYYDKAGKTEHQDLSRATAANPIKEEVQPSTEKLSNSQTDPSPIASDPAPTQAQAIKTVKKGDNLFRMTKKVYGYADGKLIEKVKQNNPHLKDVNKILIGHEIFFPEIAGTKAEDKIKAEVKAEAK